MSWKFCEKKNVQETSGRLFGGGWGEFSEGEAIFMGKCSETCLRKFQGFREFPGRVIFYGGMSGTVQGGCPDTNAGLQVSKCNSCDLGHQD